MNHDLIGIKELLKIQSNQINRIKFYTRIDNEKYLREHPEIEFIIQQFLVKLLEDQPRLLMKKKFNNYYILLQKIKKLKLYWKKKKKKKIKKFKKNLMKFKESNIII